MNPRRARFLGHILFDGNDATEILRDPAVVSRIVKMRNDISHGNDPITLEIIEETTTYLKPLEDAAFRVLQGVRSAKLAGDR